LTNQPTKLSDSLAEHPLEEFKFETLTLDSNGEITERRNHTAQQFTQALGNGSSLDMVVVPEGTFLMGSLSGQGYEDECPRHNVRVPGFLMGKYPVTQAQWRAVMGQLPPCRTKGLTRPVDRVSWNDASAFCERLSQLTGRAYRLPTEAEWEYACRAGTTTPFYCGETITTDQANYVGEHIYRSEPKGVYRHGSTQVGSFAPNPFGLYDMHGNVWEWCADTWHDDYSGAPANGSIWEANPGSPRILRGGCWHDTPDLCRSATRLKQNPGEGEDFFGLRVALASLEQNPTIRSSQKQATIARRIRAWLHR